MKRLLLPALIAAAIHAVLLGTDFGAFGRKPAFKPEMPIVVLNLISGPTAKVQPAAAAKAHERPAIKPTPLPEPKAVAKKPPKPKAGPAPALKRKPPRRKKAPLPPPKPLPTPQRQIPPAAAPEKSIAEPSLPPAPLQTKKENPAKGERTEIGSARKAAGSESAPPLTDGFADKSGPSDTLRTPAATPSTGLESGNATEAAAQEEPAVIEARPRYSINPKPGYPLIARKKGYQGTVVLDVFVNKQGRVVDMKIFRSSGYAALDKAALAAVRRWAFEPARNGAQAVEMWVQVPIRFKLK